MDQETQLWIDFVFGGQIPPQRAKSLLEQWGTAGLSLAEVYQKLPQQAAGLGLTGEEAHKLHPPVSLPDTPALRWNEALYPKGLRTLELKLRPALLFYLGESNLLQRPLIYFFAADLDEIEQELAQETASLVLGEYVLPAAMRGSLQANLLLQEVTEAEGELLLFIRQGTGTLELTEMEKQLIEAGRLLLLSPLKPDSGPNPAWDGVLQSVELAAAQYGVLTSPVQIEAAIKSQQTPYLLISETLPEKPLPPGIKATTIPADILPWLGETLLPDSPQPSGDPLTPPEPVDLPPLPPEVVLSTLEKGGAVPEILKQRLMGKNKE